MSSSCRGRENQYYPLGSNQCRNAVCFHVAGKIPQGWREGKVISITKVLLDELQLGSASSSGPRQPTVFPWARLLFPSDLGHKASPTSARSLVSKVERVELSPANPWALIGWKL